MRSEEARGDGVGLAPEALGGAGVGFDTESVRPWEEGRERCVGEAGPGGERAGGSRPAIGVHGDVPSGQVGGTGSEVGRWGGSGAGRIWHGGCVMARDCVACGVCGS